MKTFFTIKKVLVFGLFLALIALISSLVFLRNSDEDVIQDEDFSADVARVTAFDNLNESLNTIDSELSREEKIGQAYQFAQDDSNTTKPRLDAYRACIQLSTEINDSQQKDLCYEESLLVIEELPLEDEAAHWRLYIEEVYTGESTTDRSDNEVQ